MWILIQEIRLRFQVLLSPQKTCLQANLEDRNKCWSQTKAQEAEYQFKYLHIQDFTIGLPTGLGIYDWHPDGQLTACCCKQIGPTLFHKWMEKIVIYLFDPLGKRKSRCANVASPSHSFRWNLLVVKRWQLKLRVLPQPHYTLTKTKAGWQVHTNILLNFPKETPNPKDNSANYTKAHHWVQIDHVISWYCV